MAARLHRRHARARICRDRQDTQQYVAGAGFPLAGAAIGLWTQNCENNPMQSRNLASPSPGMELRRNSIASARLSGMPIEPPEIPPATPGQPTEPPREEPPGNPRPEVPPPAREPGAPPLPQELPGKIPDD